MPQGSQHAVSTRYYQQQHTVPSATLTPSATKSACVVIVMLLSAAPSFAAAITTTGAVLVVSTPPSVIVDALESDTCAPPGVCAVAPDVDHSRSDSARFQDGPLKVWSQSMI